MYRGMHGYASLANFEFEDKIRIMIKLDDFYS